MSQLRDRECGTLLDWLKNHVSPTQPTPVRREDIAEQTGITIGNTQKGLKQLIERGYLSYDARRTGPSYYQILKDLSTITGIQLSAWIKDHQSVVDKERHRNLKQATGATFTDEGQAQSLSIDQEQGKQPGIFDTPENYRPPVDEQKGYRFVSSQPEAPKSRSQQLLEEARRLQDEAQKEAQREEEDAQQAAQVASEPVADEQPGTMPEMLAMVDARLEAIDGRINAMVHFFEQAGKALRGLAPIGPEPAHPLSEPAPAVEPTTRALLVRLVNSYAAADRKPEHDTWKWLYGQFDLRTGFNVYAKAGELTKGKDESYLTIIEQHGQIDALYKLAKKLMTLPDLR